MQIREQVSAAVLRRMIASKLRPLAEFFELPLDIESDDAFVRDVEAVVERAGDAVLRDEHELREAIATIDARFDRAWWCEDKIASMMRQISSELKEVAQAIDDYIAGPPRQQLRDDVIEEIGDAMYALARLALAVGAESGLQPIAVSMAKTVERLMHFERLNAIDDPADLAEQPHKHDVARDILRGNWRIAKKLANGRTRLRLGGHR